MRFARGLVCVGWVWIVVWACASCESHELSEGDCQAIVRRIVEFELSERGFRDPHLVDQELKAFLMQGAESRLSHCVGRRARKGVMDCVRRVPSAEELAHQCLK